MLLDTYSASKITEYLNMLLDTYSASKITGYLNMLLDTFSASKITGYLNMLLSLFNTGQKLSSTGNCLTLPIVCKLLFVWNKTYFVEKKMVGFSPEILKGVKITGKLVSGNTGCLVSRFQI